MPLGAPRLAGMQSQHRHFCPVLGAPRLAGMLYCGSRTQGPCGLRSIPLLNFIPLNSLLAWDEPGLPAAPLTRSFHLFLCLC